MWELLLQFAPWLAGVVAAIGALFYARKSGESAEQKRQYEDRLNAIMEGKLIEREIEKLSHSDLRERARQWVRDDNEQ